MYNNKKFLTVLKEVTTVVVVGNVLTYFRCGHSSNSKSRTKRNIKKIFLQQKLIEKISVKKRDVSCNRTFIVIFYFDNALSFVARPIKSYYEAVTSHPNCRPMLSKIQSLNSDWLTIPFILNTYRWSRALNLLTYLKLRK